MPELWEIMNLSRLLIACLLVFLTAWASEAGTYKKSNTPTATIIVVRGTVGNKISKAWQNAIADRVTRKDYDSMCSLQRALTKEELEWEQLIRAQAVQWNMFPDSLMIPFGDIPMKDTIYVLLGCFGTDDAFTYKDQTVCFDLTAFSNVYGSAILPVNRSRIDRIFAHEFTHLIHKEWAIRNNLQLKNFRDSILWECLYEGIGMYRSLPERWMPRNDTVPEITQNALKNLAPVFVDRMIAIHRDTVLTSEQRRLLHAGLSRGPVDKKWGAFTVGIWLAMEADGDDRKLVLLMNRGLEAVLELAGRYLGGKELKRFKMLGR
jgi:hypothetical protein